MKNKNQWQLDDNFIENKLTEAFGCTNQQLAEELDRYQEQAAVSDAMPRGPEGEFQRILNRLEVENGNIATRSKRIRLRKITKLVVAAAVMGSMVLGSGIWVGARRTREYQMRERSDLENVVVFGNNPDNVIVSDDEESEIEKAYDQIEKELGIEVMELSYLPDGMIFNKSTIIKRKGLIRFFDGKRELFFYQGLNDNTSSFSLGFSAEGYKTVYNSFLDKEIEIYSEILEDGSIDLSARIIKDNEYYILRGSIDAEEFQQIVCGIKRRRD